jgi:hypothetical protein
MCVWGWRAAGMVLTAAAALGCSAPGPNLRTPQPEQITVPPEDDPRYSRPLEYPKELLNRPPVKPSNPSGASPVRGGPSGGAIGPQF